MSDTIFADFPFEEVKRPDGDYFYRISELEELGYIKSQIWSVVDGDEEIDESGQRWCYYTFGPSHHYVNLVGYVGTQEHHDGETYYQESLEMEPYPEDFDDDPS